MTGKMLNKWLWLDVCDLETELRQLQEEGKDVSDVRAKFRRLIRLGSEKLAAPGNQQKARELLDECTSLRMRKDYRYVEPSDLSSIRKLRGPGVRKYKECHSDRKLRDHLRGAWLGRCAGCLLGKAAEGIKADRFWPFLKRTGQWPVRDYITFGKRGKVAEEFPDVVKRKGCDRIDHMPVDDDTNYTTSGYLVVRKHGGDFTSADVARFWMGNIPLLSTCTAERVAYRNFAEGIAPPGSAARGNPYREWIGAQIRADAFGYVAMGNPELAAEFAWRDASISHVKNGIYGEMLMAAVIAAAPYEDDPGELLRAGLGEIPHQSRLHEDITRTMEWHTEGLGYDEAVERIHQRWDDHDPHDWCHTNSNAVICAVALLWGEGDFTRSLGMAVQPAFDTDCNGATVGSVVGMMLGARKIPDKWTAPLNDTLHTSLRGHDVVKISDMAAETFNVYRQLTTGG